MPRLPAPSAYAAAAPAAVLAVALLAPVPDGVARAAAGWGLVVAGAWAAVLADRRARAGGDPGWARVTRTIALWTAGQCAFAAAGGSVGEAGAFASAFFLLTAASAADVVLRSPQLRQVSVWAAALDAVAAGVAVGGLLWEPVLRPAAHATSPMQAVPFPLLEVGVVAFGISVLAQSGACDRALVAMVTGTGFMLVGDLHYVRDLGDAGYHLGGPADVLWVASVGSLAFVAARGVDHHRGRLRWWHHAWPAVPLVTLAAEAMRQHLGGAISTSVVSCGVTAVLVFVIRQLVLHHEIVSLSTTLGEDRDRLAEAAEAMAGQERRWRSLILHSSDVVVVLDEDLLIRFTTPSVERVLGYGPEERLGQAVADFLHPEDVAAVAEDLLWIREQPGGSVRTAIYRYRHADGRWLRMEATATNLLHDPDVRGIVCNLRDVTDRVVAEELLRHQATHDSLTRLPNRAAVRQWLAARTDEDRSFGFVLLDLDGFKEVNDALGHPAGDELLCRVADRLRASVRDHDLVGRLGGDEFVAVVPLEDPSDLDDVAARLLASLGEPMEIAGWTLAVSASAGGAVGRASDLDEALQQADIAMYRAKRLSSGGTYATYGTEDEQDRLLDLELTSALRQAIAEGTVGVWYQVKVDAATGRSAGVEALSRWFHPVHGQVSPATFVPLAERAGLVGPLTELVLDRATAQAANWRADGLEVPVAVNVSPLSLRDRRFADGVLARLCEASLPAHLLEIEITEAAVADPTDTVLGNLVRLREAGVRVAVDDFGTGYSSLSYLKELPVDTLKIDRSFVSGLDGPGPDREIVRAICALATSVGLDVVAEGVETTEIAEQLVRVGCAVHQGFLYHRPSAPADVTAALVRRWDDAESRAG